MNLDTAVANGQAAQGAAEKFGEQRGESGQLTCPRLDREPSLLLNSSPEKLKAINAAPFLCQSKVRKFLLEQAGRTRAHKYTRVSEQTLIELNEAVRQWCICRIARLPSMGRTI